MAVSAVTLPNGLPFNGQRLGFKRPPLPSLWRVLAASQQAHGGIYLALPAVVTRKRQNASSPLHNFFLSSTAMKIKLHLLPPHVACSVPDEGAGLRIFSERSDWRCAHPLYRKEVEGRLLVVLLGQGVSYEAGLTRHQASRVAHHAQSGS